MAKKIIDKANQIAKKEGIKQRQSYKRVSKKLVRFTYNSKHPKRRKNANKAQRKLKTIAGRVVRELMKKLSEETLQNYQEELLLYQRILNQKKQDKNKIYSIHKPFTACIAKGKAHKSMSGKENSCSLHILLLEVLEILHTSKGIESTIK